MQINRKSAAPAGFASAAASGSRALAVLIALSLTLGGAQLPAERDVLAAATSHQGVAVVGRDTPGVRLRDAYKLGERTTPTTIQVGLVRGPGLASSVPGGMAPRGALGVAVPTTQPPPTAQPNPTKSRPSFGVNVHTLWDSWKTFPAEYATYRAAGSEWIRTDVYWEHLEPEAKGDLSTAYLGQIDAAVDGARAAGMRPLLIVMSTPPWARGPGTERIAPPTNTADYADAVSFLVDRYRGQGVAFELWNEPNEPKFFAGGDPAAYTRLACAAYQSAKRSDPSATIVAGSLSREDTSWLARAYTAGFAHCFDALSVHPYLNPPRLPDGTVDGSWQPRTNTGALVSIMRSNGDGDRPIWFTEFGWASDPDPGAAPFENQVTPAQQADFTIRFLQTIETDLPYVTVAIIYLGKDPSGSSGAEAHFGLMTAQLEPKPVLSALRDYLTVTRP